LKGEGKKGGNKHGKRGLTKKKEKESTNARTVNLQLGKTKAGETSCCRLKKEKRGNSRGYDEDARDRGRSAQVGEGGEDGLGESGQTKEKIRGGGEKKRMTPGKKKKDLFKEQLKTSLNHERQRSINLVKTNGGKRDGSALEKGGGERS